MQPLPDAWLVLELVLRGIAIGALGANGAAFYRSATGRPVRIAGVLFFASVIAYVINSCGLMRGMLGPWGVPATLLSLGGGGYFWLFVHTLFEDRPITPRALGPAALLTLVGLFGLQPSSVQWAIWVVHNVIELVFAAHALYIVVSSWRGDLVEERRRIRGPFMAIVTIYVMVLSGIEIGESLGYSASWYSLFGASALAVFCVAGNLMFLGTRGGIFGAAIPEAPSGALPVRADPVDQAGLMRLNEAMTEQEAWKDENLSIGTLAEKLGMPEHRLRRLINDSLGHRNFAAFVNAHRIEAAKTALADPALLRKTVAAIAFDLGFGSLGPFNRAFRDATGTTPTQWRRDALERQGQPAASPNPENTG